MSLRHLVINLCVCMLLGGLAPSIPALAQTPAEPTPATDPGEQPAEKEKSARPKVTAKQLLSAAYEKTKSAQSVDDFSEIIEHCERTLGAKLSPENLAYAHQLAAWAYNKRGEAYAEQAAALAEQGQERKANELDEVALADFESALDHDPQKWKALHNRGVSRGLRGRTDEALADFTKVIELNPAFRNAWFNRAELLAKQGKYEEAAIDYTEAIKLQEGDAGALLGRGNALLRLEKFRPALVDFNQALALAPENPQALAGRGDVRAVVGQWEEAAEDYRQAIKQSPKLGRAYRGAAWLMATCPEENYRNAELALQSARKAVQLDGNGDYAYLDTLAAALANAGEYEDAVATQERALQIAPDAVMEELRGRLSQYTAGRPYRSPTRTVQGESEEQVR